MVMVVEVLIMLQRDYSIIKIFVFLASHGTAGAAKEKMLCI